MCMSFGVHFFPCDRILTIREGGVTYSIRVPCLQHNQQYHYSLRMKTMVKCMKRTLSPVC